MDPSAFSAHYYLGRAYQQKGRLPEAIASFEEAVELSKGVPPAMSALAYAYASAGRKREAEEVLAKLTKRSTERYIPAYDFAVVYAGLAWVRQFAPFAEPRRSAARRCAGVALTAGLTALAVGVLFDARSFLAGTVALLVAAFAASALASIGVRVQSASAAADQSAAIASDAKTAEAAKSGVNLDEEAARLIQYQQSYQAAAKMLQIAQSVFDTLLQIGK